MESTTKNGRLKKGSSAIFLSAKVTRWANNMTQARMLNAKIYSSEAVKWQGCKFARKEFGVKKDVFEDA